MRSISKSSDGLDTGNRKPGVTFVELLIVVSMLSMLSLAIYATCNNGIKIWQKINQGIPEEKLNIFFDKFNSDLRNCFKFSNIAFLGQDGKIEFAALVYNPREQVTTVGKVRYSYDQTSGIVTREQIGYSQIFNAEGGTHRQLLKNVTSLKFHYYFYDAQKKEYLWQDAWEGDTMPLAARVELEVAYDNRIGTFTRTVTIPASS
jgi:hypothetical protein